MLLFISIPHILAPIAALIALKMLPDDKSKMHIWQAFSGVYFTWVINNAAEILQDDIQSAFETIVQSKALTNAKVFVPKKNRDKSKRDVDDYISYQAKDFHTEAG